MANTIMFEEKRKKRLKLKKLEFLFLNPILRCIEEGQVGNDPFRGGSSDQDLLGLKETGHSQASTLGFIDFYLAEPFSEFGFGDGSKAV